MQNATLGIDIAKYKFDVALFINHQYKTMLFPNNPQGFEELVAWLTQHHVTSLHACMEATNRYGDALAHFLVNNNFIVSVINPAQIKAFAKSQLLRTKTDKVDAKVIAHFCFALKPQPWIPQPLHILELQAFVQRLDALLDMQTQEQNRFDNAPVNIQLSIQSSLDFLKKQIQLIKKQIQQHIDNHPDLKQKQDLLDSIPGIGKATIAKVLAFMHDVTRFPHAKHITAFVGLNPKHYQSGSSINGKSRLSKIGNSTLRRALYFPAIVAIRHNIVIQQFSQRLSQSHKSKMTIIGAVMRKLLTIIYGVLKSNKPFDPALASPKKS